MSGPATTTSATLSVLYVPDHEVRPLLEPVRVQSPNDGDVPPSRGETAYLCGLNARCEHRTMNALVVPTCWDKCDD